MAVPTVRDMKRGSLTRTSTVNIWPGRVAGVRVRVAELAGRRGAGRGEHCLHLAGPWRGEQMIPYTFMTKGTK